MVPRYWILSVLALCIVLGDLALGQELAKGWAWSGIAAATLGNQAAPAPAPGPAPSGTCETCSGTGKVGDGRVFQICKDCNGTGKITAAPAPVKPKATAAAPAPVVYRKICINGQCHWVPVEQPQQAASKQDNPEVTCEGGVCYPVPQVQQRYQTRQPARMITRQRSGWFYRR